VFGWQRPAERESFFLLQIDASGRHGLFRYADETWTELVPMTIPP